MTVNETLIVCKILKENGYGNYEMTTECGFNTLQKYVWTINDDCQEIDMEGHYDPDIVDEYDIPINRLIYEALAKCSG